MRRGLFASDVGDGSPAGVNIHSLPISFRSPRIAGGPLRCSQTAPGLSQLPHQ